MRVMVDRFVDGAGVGLEAEGEGEGESRWG